MKAKSMVWKIIVATLMLTLVAAVAAMAGQETITGTIQQTDKGLVLAADNGDQLIVKDRDVSDMVGKQVRATGTVAEDDNGRSISITSIQEVSDKMDKMDR